MAYKNKEYSKIYYQKHKKELDQKHKEWAKRNPEKITEMAKRKM